MNKEFSNPEILKRELEKGNQRALTFLIDTYHQPLCVYIYSLSNDYEGAQDIVQNVFIKVWTDRQKLGRVKSLKNFLYKSVYNGFIDQWRKDKRMLAIESKHLENLNEIIEDSNEDLLKIKIDMVRHEIDNLPEKCKETFLLSKQEGLTNIEIANFMNVSIRTVESQINKAYRLLKQRLSSADVVLKIFAVLSTLIYS
ncbi:RNA polymerase sigma factor [Zhouia amylolytica]|uniref:RNA polymerase ECF-type sigma factor n=1 Tax=Zhouia amylolytica AD3 TaxID=1286632 RepID=W2UPP0_9FLAO|nr:sigma-70 family RNA polymerase sigma factor [Zhouia amylolytica]ETN95257.1 RNA polymerase ECF-type sigma factor [Zhouia amylolytica AD3]MCQ0112770.1 sigma-70 family RNA polymerase sigma factor [Zhouia amylolytica]